MTQHSNTAGQPATKYISVAETAAMIRKALKEAFPDMKFSVKSKKYAGGSSIRVHWTDGPNCAQVEAIALRFRGSYFDGMIDYKGSVKHMLDGQVVRFAVDHIFCGRDQSDDSIQRAIDLVFSRLRGNFERDGLAKPSVEDWRMGRIRSLQLSGYHIYPNQDLTDEIRAALTKRSDRMKVNHSPTAAKVIIIGDDAYSRSVGAGVTVIDPALRGEPSLSQQLALDAINRIKAGSTAS